MKKWKLPKKVAIAGLDYNVKLCSPKDIKRKSESHKDDDYDVMGLCDYHTRTLFINRKLNPEEMKFTFYHEVMHAVMDGTTQDDTYNDDAILHPMSRILWGVLKDVGLVI